ncbi:MAG: hypothetical protein RMK84_03075 [Oscillochloridaceae bacterium]|nr:hypothetical protein [Chloroflexaceae bacterium]MDW8389085.1 hypothetical protein [Oscillochloridaceae bacterium]
MTATSDYEQALAIIRRLDRQSRARLVAQVVQELADERDMALQRSHEAWARLAELREEFRRLGPVSPSAGEQLDLDRQHRADLLEGKIRE